MLDQAVSRSFQAISNLTAGLWGSDFRPLISPYWAPGAFRCERNPSKAQPLSCPCTAGRTSLTLLALAPCPVLCPSALPLRDVATVSVLFGDYLTGCGVSAPAGAVTAVSGRARARCASVKETDREE